MIASAYEIHPLAELVPTMNDEQFAELRADIAAHGLIEPIVLHEGKVLDGRHRLRACEETGTPPRFEEFDGSSPVEFVVSKNIKRRHLTPSQRAALAVEFLPALEAEARERQRDHAGTAPGRPAQHSVSSDTECSPRLAGQPARAAEQAGVLVGVSGVSVARAKRVKNEDPETYERVKAGEITVTAADRALRERATPRSANGAGPVALNTRRDLQRAEAHKRRLIDLASALSGLAMGVGGIDINRARLAMEPAELAEWSRSLSDSLRTLSAFRTTLNERQVA